jgi:phosphopantothenoylcysteine synthetase/decarboxylase
MADFLIYGATGYTGSLIAHEAVRRGARHILVPGNVGKGTKPVGSVAEVTAFVVAGGGRVNARVVSVEDVHALFG